MNNNDIHEIAANLGDVIARLVKILRRETSNDARLSLTERSTLSLISKNPGVLPSELAAMEKVTSQSMSQIINKLFKGGFINKTSTDKDKRKVILTITERGKSFGEKRRHEREEWLSKALIEKTTDHEKQLLVDAVKIMTKLVDSK